jgi:hypothetical protein
MERVGVVMAVIFVVFGVYSVVHPVEGLHFFSGPGRYNAIIGSDPPPQKVTKTGARVYGGISLGLGAGLAWLALYRPRR